ncbi:MAG: hypothetical protein AB1758_11040, partial [Candidatus Eremiobacterota bacterium]
MDPSNQDEAKRSKNPQRFLASPSAPRAGPREVPPAGQGPPEDPLTLARRLMESQGPASAPEDDLSGLLEATRVPEPHENPLALARHLLESAEPGLAGDWAAPARPAEPPQDPPSAPTLIPDILPGLDRQPLGQPGSVDVALEPPGLPASPSVEGLPRLDPPPASRVEAGPTGLPGVPGSPWADTVEPLQPGSLPLSARVSHPLPDLPVELPGLLECEPTPPEPAPPQVTGLAPRGLLSSPPIPSGPKQAPGPPEPEVEDPLALLELPILDPTLARRLLGPSEQAPRTPAGEDPLSLAQRLLEMVQAEAGASDSGGREEDPLVTARRLLEKAQAEEAPTGPPTRGSEPD